MSARVHAQAKATPEPSFTPVHVRTLQRCGSSHCPPGQCGTGKKKKGEGVQRYAAGPAGPTAVPPIVDEVLRSSGQPLDGATRAYMEPRFGHDFSRVRVHSDARAAESARAVNAVAYTVGRDVVFAAGQYAPGTGQGRSILAHELTHVVQQGSDTIRGKLEAGQPGDVYEREADDVARSVAGDRPVAISSPAPHQTLQRALVCARPLDIPVLGLVFNHAFVNDPPKNYAIRDLVSGNGISGCSTKTDASGAPDVPATSTCKSCDPKLGQTPADVSRCLSAAHSAYASPNIYRNLPDPGDSFRWGPNSNSYAATLAKCCADSSKSGLGIVPGWNHSPAGPCPSEAAVEAAERKGAGGAGTAPAPAAGCTYSITYANVRSHACPAGQCGTGIIYDVTKVTATGSGCPPKLEGLNLSETVVTDNGCGPGTVITGPPCPIGPGGTITGCTDTYSICGPAAAFPAAGCTDIYTQRLSVGGVLAETRTITWVITKSAGACSGTVTRT